MEKYFLLLFLFACSSYGYGQQKAVTENGDEVILYANGTWTYANRDTFNAGDIVLNENEFSKSAKANFLIKSKRIGIGCYIQSKSWSFKSTSSNQAAEYELTNSAGDLYGMIITEKLDLPLESLAAIAIENAQEAAPDLQVTHKEYRIVNGLKVIMLRMTGTIQDIRFSYYGYYHTGDGGASQLLVYSSDSIMAQKLDEVEALLNGMVKTED